MEMSESLKEKGNKEFKKGNYQAAIAYYTEALLDEKSEVFYGNRAACYINLGKYQEAVDDCKAALQIKPDYTKVIKRLVQGLIALDNIPEAKSVLEEAVARDIASKTELANEIKSVKELDETQEALDKAIQRQNWSTALYYVNEKLRSCPASVKLRLDRLEYMMEAGNNDEATKYSQQLFNELVDNPRFLYLRGMCLVNEGNLGQAKKFFTEAMKKDPDYAACAKAVKRLKKTESLKEEASSHFKSGDFKKAIEGFTACLELFPNNKNYNSSIYLNRAICFSKLKEQDKALQDLNRAIECNPDYAKAYVKRGEINTELENYEEAVRDFENAKRISPSEFGVQQKCKDAKLRLKQAKRKDYYKILGVEKDADATAIKKAYRKLALKWHPDKNSGDEAQKLKAEKMFKDIGEAYAILSDPEKRNRYDSGVDLEDIENGGGFGGAHVDPSQIFQMFFGGGGGMGGMGGMDDMGGFGFPGGMFSGMGGGAPGGGAGGRRFFKQGNGAQTYEFRFG